MSQDLTTYDSQARRLENNILEMIKHSSADYQHLNKFMQQANKSAEAARHRINSKNGLSLKKKQELNNNSYLLYIDAYHSIIHAARACGPIEAPERRNQALAEAKNKVFLVEKNMLEHSSIIEHIKPNSHMVRDCTVASVRDFKELASELGRAALSGGCAQKFGKIEHE